MPLYVPTLEMDSIHQTMPKRPLLDISQNYHNLQMEYCRANLSICSQMNYLLESIQQILCKGFATMKKIDENKTCLCNEHMNVSLRTYLKTVDMEYRFLQQEYQSLLQQFNRNQWIESRTVFQPIKPTIVNNCCGVDSKSEDIVVVDEQNLCLSNVPATEAYCCDWPNCNKMFDCEKYLNQHRRIHIRKSSYSCKHCSVRLLSQLELDEHVALCDLNNLTDKRKKPTQASDGDASPCPSMYSEKDSFSVSIQGNISPISFQSQPTPSRSSSPLAFISSIYSKASNAHKHLITSQAMQYSSTEPHYASSCPADSMPTDSTKSQLYETLKRDSREATLSCIENAIKNFKISENDLPNKLTEQKPTLKSGANKSKNVNREYKRTRYSGVGRFPCKWPNCGYTPHFLRDLRRHMYKHTGEKKHICNVAGCEFGSVWRTSLLQHQRKKHNKTTTK